VPAEEIRALGSVSNSWGGYPLLKLVP
jgi:hypothetical protein